MSQMHIQTAADARRAAEAVLAAPLGSFVTISAAPASLSQRKGYWKVLREIAEGVWIGGRRRSSLEWHKVFAGELIGYEEVTWPNGVREMRPISTTTLDRREFAQYVLQIEAIAVTGYGVEFDQARAALSEFQIQAKATAPPAPPAP